MYFNIIFIKLIFFLILLPSLVAFTPKMLRTHLLAHQIRNIISTTDSIAK